MKNKPLLQIGTLHSKAERNEYSRARRELPAKFAFSYVLASSAISLTYEYYSSD
jgi:hypothetical protein